MSIIDKKTQITNIFAFGNSYSDNGEANRISTKIKQNIDVKEAFIKPRENLYWKNRYSNGFVSVEIMAGLLQAKLVNFATGGATSGVKNYTDWMDLAEDTGVLGQIEKFQKTYGLKHLDSDALYFIFPFENDYFKHIDFELSETLEFTCKCAIENVAKAIKALHVKGAKKFMIVNCSDLTLVPYEITMQREEVAKEYMQTINQELPKKLDELKEELSISVLLYDHTKVSQEILNDKKYGITEFKKACQPTYPKIEPASKNQDSFYFWDEWHFSRAVHQVFGKDMYQSLTNFNWK